LTFGSATSIRDAVASRQTSAAEVAREALARADLANSLNAFLQLFPDKALAAAKDIDARLAAGEKLPLAGVPVAIKDNICLGPDLAKPGDARGYGGRTTCASRILENYESPYTATAAQRLIDAGAVIIGKTNLDEFAMGSSTEHSAFGPTRNPWDYSRVPGGSSGGSAAAVAARVVPAALGSDTGGSIRQPAGLCGLVGVKPTYGRVSRYGLVAFASSLDQIGPLTTTVGDAALLLDVMCGQDPRDSTSAARPATSFVAELERPVLNLTVGVPRQARSESNHPGVAAALENAIAVFRSLGALVVDVDLPLTDYGIAAYYIVAPAEASSNLARFDGIRYGRRAELKHGEGLLDLYCKSRSEGFGAEVKRRIMLGTHVLSSGYYEAYYNTALKVRRKILADFNAAFAGDPASPQHPHSCHVILMPATPGPAFKLGEKTADPLAMYLEDVYTVGVNLAGLPGMTVPAGFAEVEGKRLPVGVQLVAPAFEESVMLRVARMFERETNFGAQAPPL
jgi:aspartyl-tRNA(Asn)/glutamyl-tRNA(Gln) amidotransferase subunit A